MALREWMVPHQWMIKYTPQTEWIERRGLLVWMAEVFTSLGAGLYLVSLLYNNLWGMLFGWLIIVFLKIPIHIAYLGKPWRFWRTMPPFTGAWKTSWITRGTFFTGLFIGFGLVQLFMTRFLPGTGLDITFKIIGGAAAVPAGIYGGFVLNKCRSIPLWNSVLLPAVFLVAGIADGTALIMAVGLFDPGVNIQFAENSSRILLIFNALLIWAYLWQAIRVSKTGKYSAMLLMRGSLALPFWAGLITGGTVMPFGISVYSYFAGADASSLLIIAIALHTAGAFFFKYCLLKAGIHNPLLR